MDRVGLLYSLGSSPRGFIVTEVMVEGCDPSVQWGRNPGVTPGIMAPKLQMLILEASPSSGKGGQPLSTLEGARFLAQGGHGITLVAAQAGDLLEYYQRFCRAAIVVHPTRLDPTHWLSSSWGLLRTIGKISILRGTPPQNPPSSPQQSPHDRPLGLIYLSNHTSALLAVLLGKLFRWPVVLHIRTAITPGLIFHRQDRWAIAHIHHYLAVSESVKNEWVAHFKLPPQAITVIPNGTDLGRFAPTDHPQALRQPLGLAPNPLLISYVGRLAPQKGLEILLRAFAQLGATLGQPVQLAIAGTPSGFGTQREAQAYQQKLLQLQQELGLNHQVQFLGHLADPVPLYQASDLTVLPSIYPDPCPRSVLESLACGVPIVASRTGGIQETLQGEWAEFLVEPQDPETLARGLGQWIQWRTTDPTLGDRCRAYAQARLGSTATWQRVESALLTVAQASGNRRSRS